MEIKVDAIVIRTADYGESDRMLTLFTLQRGKLSAAAVIMAIAMVVIIAVLFKVEDWFGKDVEG